MKLRRFTLLALSPLPCLGLAGTASAAPGGGATVTEYSDCRAFREGIICSESRWVENDTQTRYGSNSIAIGTSSFVYTGSDGCTWSSTQEKREHWASNFGIRQSHVIQNTSTSNTCFGDNVQCTESIHFLSANGDSVIYDREVECGPVVEA